MSPTVKTTYSRQEVRENLDAFHVQKWGTDTPEPDDRVTVLVPAHPAQETQGFLCRLRHGWRWASNAVDLVVQFEAGRTPLSWNEAIRDLGGDSMRVPTAFELDAGGFRITVGTEPEEQSQDESDDEPDEAEVQIDHGFFHLNRVTLDGVAASRAQAHFLASIAISLHELVALHKKYDPENMEIVVDPGPDEDQETRAAADPSVPDEDFPYAR